MPPVTAFGQWSRAAADGDRFQPRGVAGQIGIEREKQSLTVADEGEGRAELEPVASRQILDLMRVASEIHYSRAPS